MACLPMFPSFKSSEPTVPLVSEPVAGEFPKIEGAQIAAATYGKRVAGDFYDFVRVSPERILFGLLDVAGRREDNQPVLAAAQKIFRTLGAELFSRADMNESEAMTELCLCLNRGIMDAAAGVRSCPAFIGCYQEKFGTLCYSNAGHTPGLLLDSTGIVELGSTGLPLGLFSHATSEAPIAGMARGAVLLLVSQGVVEGEYDESAGEDAEFGLNRVKDQLKKNQRQAERSLGPQELCASILNAAVECACGPLVHQDMTALALVRPA
ncbi:MAG: SpoIIE family protein phosphatase [Candidatus Sulfotelmatobacter sp.]